MLLGEDITEISPEETRSKKGAHVLERKTFNTTFLRII
jgi:hypothetical protein